MPPILESLIPVFLTIALGWGVRASGTITQDHWQGFERVTYYVLIPALVITTLAMADQRNVPILFRRADAVPANPADRAVPVRDTALAGAARGHRRACLHLAPAGRGALEQLCSDRPRRALHGKDGVALTAVAFAFLIPIANLMSAYALARYRHGGKPLDPAALP